MKQLSRFLNSFGFIFYGVILFFLIYTNIPWYFIMLLNAISTFVFIIIFCGGDDLNTHWSYETPRFSGACIGFSSLDFLIYFFSFSGVIYSIFSNYHNFKNDLFSYTILIFHPIILLCIVALMWYLQDSKNTN